MHYFTHIVTLSYFQTHPVVEVSEVAPGCRLDAFVANVMITQIELADLRGLEDWPTEIFLSMKTWGSIWFYHVLSWIYIYGFSSWLDHVVLLHGFIYETWGSQHLNKGSKKVLFSTDMHAMGIWVVDLPGLAEAIWLFSFLGYTEYKTNECQLPATEKVSFSP